jgi:hypothetical protein
MYKVSSELLLKTVKAIDDFMQCTPADLKKLDKKTFKKIVKVHEVGVLIKQNYDLTGIK